MKKDLAFLYFFVFIIIYAIVVIAYLVINLLMPDVDVSTASVVISICIKQISIDRKCLQRFRDNSKGKRRNKILLCKVCFLVRRDKQRDREPSPFGPLY